MAKKKPKIATPEWIIQGYDSKEDYEKAKGVNKSKKNKVFSIKQCPKCNSDDVGVVVGEIGVWECKKCGWKGKEVNKKELSEDEFMKYLDEKEEEVA